MNRADGSGMHRSFPQTKYLDSIYSLTSHLPHSHAPQHRLRSSTNQIHRGGNIAIMLTILVASVLDTKLEKTAFLSDAITTSRT